MHAGREHTIMYTNIIIQMVAGMEVIHLWINDNYGMLDSGIMYENVYVDTIIINSI